MKFDKTIELLETKQRELDVLLEDATTEKSDKIEAATLYDEITAAIDVLKREEARVKHDTLRVPIKWSREEENRKLESISVTLTRK